MFVGRVLQVLGEEPQSPIGMAISYSLAAAKHLLRPGMAGRNSRERAPTAVSTGIKGERADEKGMVGVEGAGRKKLGNDLGFPSLLTLLGS